MGRCHEWEDRRGAFSWCGFSEASSLLPGVFQVPLREALPGARWAHTVLQMVLGGFKGRSGCTGAAGDRGCSRAAGSPVCVRRAPGACLVLCRSGLCRGPLPQTGPVRPASCLPRGPECGVFPSVGARLCGHPSAFKDSHRHSLGGSGSCPHLADEKSNKVWRGGATSVEWGCLKVGAH